MRGPCRASTFRPRRLSDRISRTLGRREDDHRLFVVMLRQGTHEARFGVVGVAVGVAVLVADCGGGQVSVALGSAAGASAAARATRSAGDNGVVGDVWRVAQAWLFAIV